MSDLVFFNFLRRKKREWSRSGNASLTQAEVDEGNAVLKARDAAKAAGGSPTAQTSISPSSAAPAQPTGLPGKKGPLAAIVGLVAATSLLTTIPKEEGTKLAAYRDIVGVPTICSGDTNNVRIGMVETPEGCRQRLESQLVAFASGVMKCSPTLSEDGRELQRAAATSLAYNVGLRNYCRSTVDRRFDAGDFKGGCNAFLMWNRAGGRVIRGLALRRERERQLCLKGLT